MLIIKLTPQQHKTLGEFFKRVPLTGLESDLWRELRDIIDSPFMANIVQKEDLTINRKEKENGDKIQTD